MAKPQNLMAHFSGKLTMFIGIRNDTYVTMLQCNGDFPPTSILHPELAFCTLLQIFSFGLYIPERSEKDL